MVLIVFTDDYAHTGSASMRQWFDIEFGKHVETVVHKEL